ncbi:MAG: hypothetical protein K9J37_06175 [Saprospiraceae bacterium]|nr:hypothetical protein [Saprospiraceae bacterium]MCF8249479.1 hypothetical protein [Saprospiraceae bacterium]MCF8283162.1 hypothetical protein [Bacteroidales bacterium]MCF8310697.1 hypothetical protein [Saprospiraceae bacterium]MCF8439472.1 hypothetical protein [Saprospiraceae bacterium]
MVLKLNPLPDISPKLFWDTDVSSINWELNAPYVIERVLSRGAWKDFKNLLSFYGKTRLKNEVQQLRYLDQRSLAFCSVYFNVPIEKFRCYTFKQSNQPHWNY